MKCANPLSLSISHTTNFLFMKKKNFYTTSTYCEICQLDFLDCLVFSYRNVCMNLYVLVNQFQKRFLFIRIFEIFNIFMVNSLMVFSKSELLIVF